MITVKNPITFEQLLKVKPPRPDTANMNQSSQPIGKDFEPVCHGELVLAVIHHLKVIHQVEAIPDQIALSNDQTQLTMTFLLRGKVIPKFLGMDVMLGILTSNARRKATQVFTGLRQQKTGFGDLVKSKSVGKFSQYMMENLNYVLDQSMERILGLRKEGEEYLKANRVRGSGLLEIADLGIIPWVRVKHATQRVKQDWFNAIYLWAAVAREIQHSPPHNQMPQLEALTNWFKENAKA